MVRLVVLFTLFLLGACQCRLTENPLVPRVDGGSEEEEEGSPRIFPLKVGDRLHYPVVGGTTSDCPGSSTSGDCQRVLVIDYIIASVGLNSRDRWEIIADATYQASDDFLDVGAIAPLILSGAAPFGQVSEARPLRAEGATFRSDRVMDDEMVPNDWPFFEYRLDDATLFEDVGNQLCARFTELDAEANCRIQHGDQKFEVYYRDTQAGAAAMLHKVRQEFHQFGFVCGWDEALIPFEEGVTVRDESSFGPGGAKDVAASFFAPQVIRDGVTYQCSCSTQQCRSSAGDCLNIDPEIPPAACQ